MLELNLHLLSANSKPSLASEAKGFSSKRRSARLWSAAIDYIDIDDYVEATPKLLRLRKRILDATARKRAAAAAA